MARLYTNENFPAKVAAALQELGHDVLTVQEAGNANQSIDDAALLSFATEQNRAVITLNRRDFIRLHQADARHAGIIVCTQDPDTERQAHRIHEAIVAMKTLAGQLIRVNRPQN